MLPPTARQRSRELAVTQLDVCGQGRRRRGRPWHWRSLAVSGQRILRCIIWSVTCWERHMLYRIKEGRTPSIFTVVIQQSWTLRPCVPDDNPTCVAILRNSLLYIATWCYFLCRIMSTLRVVKIPLVVAPKLQNSNLTLDGRGPTSAAKITKSIDGRGTQRGGRQPRFRGWPLRCWCAPGWETEWKTARFHRV